MARPSMSLVRVVLHNLRGHNTGTRWGELQRRSQHQSTGTEYETVLVEEKDNYAIVMLNRPKALNALNTQVMKDVTAAALQLDARPSIKAIVITGSGGKAFAAGADIKEMATKTQEEVRAMQLFAGWGRLREVRKPLIAAVNGFALGGGCELAMACDIIIASENAQFGQPEIQLGVLPGIGGTQRLTRLVGRVKAMDMMLTGERITASEALQWGLVSRVVAADQLMGEVDKLARKIASFSLPALIKAKACVHYVDECGLEEGIHKERELFYSCFDHEDQKEGMAAFIDKRIPAFKDK